MEEHIYGFLYHEGESPYYALIQAPDPRTAATTLLAAGPRDAAAQVLVESVEVIQDGAIVPGPPRVLATLVLRKRA